jgi:hypothetical protein
MKRLKNLTLFLGLALASVYLTSCKEDEEIFAKPTVAVTVDNALPFPGDKINFTIAVAGLGGLQSVTLNGASIKTYTANETTDNFTFEYTVPASSTLGPTAVVFEVTDKQGTPLKGTFTTSLTIQNPDFRGTPVVLFDFQSAIPNSTISAITRDIGGNSWENAYTLTFDVADPDGAAANKVLQADRAGAHEWYFNGGGGIFLEFAEFISEDEIAKLVSGERVLQMNLYFKENPNMVSVSKFPKDDNNPSAQGDAVSVDMGWKLNDAAMAWDFDSQDSVKGIPVILEIGNKAAWAWNDGNPLGKKFFLVGSITKANEWQTVTFSRRKSAGLAGENYPGMPILVSETTTPAFLDDPAVGLDQINYLALVLNNRKTEFVNSDGWYEFDKKELYKKADTQKNSYFIDNVRIIDTADFDKNPNN